MLCVDAGQLHDGHDEMGPVVARLAHYLFEIGGARATARLLAARLLLLGDDALDFVRLLFLEPDQVTVGRNGFLNQRFKRVCV